MTGYFTAIKTYTLLDSNKIENKIIKFIPSYKNYFFSVVFFVVCTYVVILSFDTH